MCELIIAIIFIVFLVGGGITTLRTGRIRATNNSVVEGRPAQIIGWLLLLSVPFPVIAISVTLAVASTTGEPVGGLPFVLSCSPILFFPLIAVIIGLATARPIVRKTRAPVRLDEEKLADAERRWNPTTPAAEHLESIEEGTPAGGKQQERQLAGAVCGRCGRRIAGPRLGMFCKICGSPVHHICAEVEQQRAPPGTCPMCGCDLPDIQTVT